jgi:hypothetical protein
MNEASYNKRLNDLVILCIDKDVIENINIETIINNFASGNTSKNCLYKYFDIN